MLLSVIDDENENRELMIKIVNDIMRESSIEYQIDEYNSGEQFLKSKIDYDLIFLDIYMDELTGIDVARRLRVNNKHTKIVFLTTSNEFASEAFEVEAYNYLIKPATKEKVTKIIKRFVIDNNIKDKITVFVNRVKEDIYYKDIYYVEVINRKTVIHTVNGDKETILTLQEVENMLPKKIFIRPIRYAIVSLEQVKDIPGDELHLKNGTVINISRNERDTIKQQFADYKWNKLRRTMK